MLILHWIRSSYWVKLKFLTLFPMIAEDRCMEWQLVLPLIPSASLLTVSRVCSCWQIYLMSRMMNYLKTYHWKKSQLLWSRLHYSTQTISQLPVCQWYQHFAGVHTWVFPWPTCQVIVPPLTSLQTWLTYVLCFAVFKGQLPVTTTACDYNIADSIWYNTETGCYWHDACCCKQCTSAFRAIAPAL